MLKNLIFLSLLVLSLQIKNCGVSIKVCKGCKTGYTLINSNDPEDIDCIKNELLGNANDNCLYYRDSAHTYCSECKDGFKFDYSTGEQKCVQAPEHCSYLIGNECGGCISYYNLTDNKKCIEMKCLSFSDGECRCERGYYQNDNKECKKIPIEHCEEGNSTHCKECEDGYYLNGNKECKKIPIDHCEEGNSAHCDDCERGYYLKGPKECAKLPIEHCKRGSETYCNSCEYGYY